MALSKEIVLDSGVTAQYHKITKIDYDSSRKTNTTITVASFLDQESRDSGKNPVSINQYSYAVNLDEENYVSSVYNGALMLEQFEGATEV